MFLESRVTMQNSALTTGLMAASIKAMQAQTSGIVALLAHKAAVPPGPPLAYRRALDVRV
jgi:hypothetical protein